MRVFVGKLNDTTGSKRLEELFGQFGKVKFAKVIKDRETGQSKRFAFIEMPNDREAEDAIWHLNGVEFEGRKLIVNKAKSQQTGSFKDLVHKED